MRSLFSVANLEEVSHPASRGSWCFVVVVVVFVSVDKLSHLNGYYLMCFPYENYIILVYTFIHSGFHQSDQPKPGKP